MPYYKVLLTLIMNKRMNEPTNRQTTLSQDENCLRYSRWNLLLNFGRLSCSRDYIKFANIFWQTYKLPNYILPTFILPTLHFTKLFLCKLTIYQIHFAKLTFFRFLENLQISFILPNLHFAKPSFCQTLQFVVTLRMVLPLS